MESRRKALALRISTPIISFLSFSSTVMLGLSSTLPLSGPSAITRWSTSSCSKYLIRGLLIDDKSTSTQAKAYLLGFARLLTATRLRPPAQGWPLRLPWDSGSKTIQPQSGCVIPRRIKDGRNRLAVGNPQNLVLRVLATNLVLAAEWPN